MEGGRRKNRRLAHGPRAMRATSVRADQRATQRAGAGARPAAHPPRPSTERPTPLPSRTAKSRHQAQLGVDGADVAHALSLGLLEADNTSP
jgi:hypothetical protein